MNDRTRPDDDADGSGLQAKPAVDASSNQQASQGHADHAQQQQRLSDAQHAPNAQHSPSTNTSDHYARPQYKPSIAQANYSTEPVTPLHGPDATPQAPVTLPPNLVNLSINPIIIANRLKAFIPPAQFAEIQAAAADRPRVQALLRVVFEELTAHVNASANGAAKAALNAAAADPAAAVDNYYRAATLLKFQRPGAASPAPRLVAAIAPATFAGSSSVAKTPVQAETIIGTDSAAQSGMSALAPRGTNATTSAAAIAATAVSQLAGNIEVDVSKLTVVYRASWVATNPTEHILQGLLALRGAGAISWAKDEALRRVAALTSLPEASSKKNQIVLQITAAVFAVIGLPPGKDAVAGRRGNGLGVSIAMATELPVAMKVTLPESERSKVSEALWVFTQLPIATEPDDLHGYVGGAGVYVELSETECAAIFGAEAWRGYVKKTQQRAPKKSPAEAAQADYTKGELPARLTQHGGEVVSGDNVPFAVVIDWELVRLGLFSPAQRAAFESHESAYDVAWHYQRVDGKSAKAFAGATRGANQDALTKRIGLALQPGEVSADFKVTAKIGSNHFLPAEVATLVTVKTQAARLDNARTEIMGPGASSFASPAMTAKENNFDLGLAKDQIARRGDDHGTRYDGDMDPRHVMQSLEERKATREIRIAELEAARDYLRQRVQASDVKEAIASFDEQIRKLREEGKHIESDVAAGWQMFDVRGAYVSRTEGVASGPLDLYGEVQRYAASPAGPLVGVRIRDLSRRFEQQSYVFNAIAPTFDAALEAAFVDFCKTYPTGTVAMFAQAMGPAAKPGGAVGGAAAPKMQPTGKMLGFELATTSRWKDIKSVVVEPAVQILMGAASTMAMICAPWAAAPLMVAQMVIGSATTIDDMLEKSSRGTLHTKGLVQGLGQLAMNLLPVLAQGRMATASIRAEANLARAEAAEVGAIGGGNEATIAKAGTNVDKALRGVVKPIQVIRYATFGGIVAGNVLIMREETLQLLAQLKAQDVAAIAEMHVELVRLSATTHASDPRLLELTRAIEARAAAVRGRFSEAMTTVVGGQLAMLIPQGMWDLMEKSAHVVKKAGDALGLGDKAATGGTSDAGGADAKTTNGSSGGRLAEGEAASGRGAPLENANDSTKPGAKVSKVGGANDSGTSTQKATGNEPAAPTAEERAPSSTVSDETLTAAGETGAQPRVLGEDAPDGAATGTGVTAERPARSGGPKKSAPEVKRVEPQRLETVIGHGVTAIGRDSVAIAPHSLTELHAGWQSVHGKPAAGIHYDAKTNRAYFEAKVLVEGKSTSVRVVASLGRRIETFADIDVGHNLVIGKPVSLAHGQEIIRALLQGDASKLSAVGLKGPARMPTDASTEFGLGRTSDGRAVIIRGQNEAVDWAGLPGIHPDGHTHPSVPKNDLYGRSIEIEKLLERTPVPLVERALVFPSNADVIMMAEYGIEGHKVFTPFTFDGKIVKKALGNEPLLEITINNPRHIGRLAEGEPVYNARFEATAGKYRFEVEIWLVGGADDGKMELTLPKGVLPVDALSKGAPKAAKATQADTLQPKPIAKESTAKASSPNEGEAAQHRASKVPALVAAMEKGGIAKAELEELRGKYGDTVIHALDLIIGKNKQQSRAALNVILTAEKIGAHSAFKDATFASQFVEAIASGKFENLRTLPSLLRKVLSELNDPIRPEFGTINVVKEAIAGVRSGKRMGLEGRDIDLGDPESGRADIINYTDKQAIQNKVVTGNMGTLVANIKAAMHQLSGATGEVSPFGYTKIARIVLEGNHAMKSLTRADLFAALQNEIKGADGLLIPKDVRLIIVNEASGRDGFVVTNSDLRPQ